MLQRVGIVLKRLNSPYKVAVLDREIGRIDCIATKPLCVGSLIQYQSEQKRGGYEYVSHCSITDLPLEFARDNILFWHHILELCFYFIPVGYTISSLFELLQFLYREDGKVDWNVQSKKLYLFKLLAAIGLYDALPQLVPIGRVQQLLALPIELIIREHIDEKSEQVVDEWLRTCIAEHPHIERFNTVHFLVHMGGHE